MAAPYLDLARFVPPTPRVVVPPVFPSLPPSLSTTLLYYPYSLRKSSVLGRGWSDEEVVAVGKDQG